MKLMGNVGIMIWNKPGHFGEDQHLLVDLGSGFCRLNHDCCCPLVNDSERIKYLRSNIAGLHYTRPGMHNIRPNSWNAACGILLKK